MRIRRRGRCNVMTLALEDIPEDLTTIHALLDDSGFCESLLTADGQAIEGFIDKYAKAVLEG